MGLLDLVCHILFDILMCALHIAIAIPLSVRVPRWLIGGMYPG
jgi:hypothetical protein